MARKPRSEWSESYRKRIESAERRGLTRQQARGHGRDNARGGEARSRRDRRMQRLAEQINLGQKRSPKHGPQVPDHQAVADLIMDIGPTRAMKYLEIQAKLQEAYRGYESQGTIDDYLDDLHDLFYEAGDDYPDDDWFYYH